MDEEKKRTLAANLCWFTIILCLICVGIIVNSKPKPVVKETVKNLIVQIDQKDNFKHVFEEMTKYYIVRYANQKFFPKDEDPKYIEENVCVIRIQKYTNEWESISEIKMADLLFKVIYNTDRKSITVSMYGKTGIDTIELNEEEF